jgi:glycosyltransferase involved in cell wall biosynthesis
MSLHIVFFVPMWPVRQFPNGIGTYVDTIRTALLERGHRVSVLTGVLGADCADDRVYVVPEPGRLSKLLSRIRAWLAGEEFEVFHYWESIARGLAAIHGRESVDVFEIEESFGWGGQIQGTTQIPVVVRLHGPAVFTVLGPQRETRRTLRRIAIEGPRLMGASLVLSPCRATLQALQSHYQVELPATRIVPNPLPLDTLVPVWNVENCEPDTVLFVGRFDFGKGADLMLAAFEALLSIKPTARLLFVGPDDGLICSDGVRRKFHEYCAQNLRPSTVDRIEFFGAQAREQIERLRVRARVTVMSSRWENQPYVLMEAMWQGCPVVANPSGGVAEVLEDRRTGLLADVGEPSVFAETVASLLDDSGRSESLGRAARVAVASRHGPDVVVGMAVDAYNTVRGRRPSVTTAPG